MRCRCAWFPKRFVTCGASSSAITSFFTSPQQKKKSPEAANFAGRKFPVDRLASLGFKPIEDGDRVLHQPREVLAAAKLADQARRVPGASVGDLRFLEQYDVTFAAPCQRISNRAADRPAADDDDARMTIERSCHRFSPLSASNCPGRNLAQQRCDGVCCDARW